MKGTVFALFVVLFGWLVEQRIVELTSPSAEELSQRAFAATCYEKFTEGKSNDELVQIQDQVKGSLNLDAAFRFFWWENRGDVLLEVDESRYLWRCRDLFTAPNFRGPPKRS